MRKLDTVIVRQASDDFIAFKTASAMQSLTDVEVISIVFQDCDPLMHISPRGVWHVFAKFASDQITPDHIDKAIELSLNSSR